MAFQLGSLNGAAIGTVIDWLRSSISVPVPTGWMICDGTTVSDPLSPFNGAALPDLRGRFLRGHDTITNANFGANTTYYVGGPGVQAGGNDNHVHTAGSHTHTEGAHSHSLSGSTYAYNTFNEGGSTTVLQGTPGPGQSTVNVPSESHQHRNNGSASADNGGTTGPGSGSVDAADGRPAYTGLLKIMKIR